MKIGIMTFWQAEDNYGQLLQLYALQTYLQQLGHEAFLIRYDRLVGDRKKGVNHFIKRILKGLNPVALASYCNHRIISFKIAKQNRLNNRHFDDFRRDYIVSSDYKYYSLAELQQNPPKADVYICGSDQVWNDSATNASTAFFLDFGGENVLRISYAASFGKKEISMDFQRLITPLLQKFNLLTVREEEGVAICSQCGRTDAIQVFDPTLLITPLQYLSIASKTPVVGKYCMMYLLGNETNVPVNTINSFIAESNLILKYVASQNRIDDFPKIYPTIPEWLSLMAQAECVITNSFHGTVFAILFNKPFVVFPLKGKDEGMNGRLVSILTRLQLGDRIYDGVSDLSIYLLSEIPREITTNLILQGKSEIDRILCSYLK